MKALRLPQILLGYARWRKHLYRRTPFGGRSRAELWTAMSTLGLVRWQAAGWPGNRGLRADRCVALLMLWIDTVLGLAVSTKKPRYLVAAPVW